MIPINLKGKKFGRLIVIEYDENSRKTGHAYWLTHCQCGKYKYIRGSHLTAGDVRSCGCLAGDIGRKFLKVYANSDAHKGSGNPRWKGSKAGSGSVHQWLARHFKKDKCEECGTTKVLDWALIKGKKYLHKRENFKVLCRSHHLKYDYTKQRKKKVIDKVLSKRWARKI